MNWRLNETKSCVLACIKRSDIRTAFAIIVAINTPIIPNGKTITKRNPIGIFVSSKESVP
jgi:hypothetical protein